MPNWFWKIIPNKDNEKEKQQLINCVKRIKEKERNNIELENKKNSILNFLLVERLIKNREKIKG